VLELVLDMLLLSSEFDGQREELRVMDWVDAG
jgi:hypothetical protein